jgi:hypothetical protein
MEPLTLYLRREPTTDSATADMMKNAPDKRKHAPRLDVVAYRDPEAADQVCRWPWWHTAKPTRRNKWVDLNCYRWRVEWLPDFES